MRKLILCATCIFGLMTACHKTDRTTNASIVGKWTPLKERTFLTGAMSAAIDTYFYHPACYADFRSNGYLYTYFTDTVPGHQDQYDTCQYKVDGNKLYILDHNGTWNEQDIITLTTNDLTLQENGFPPPLSDTTKTFVTDYSI